MSAQSIGELQSLFSPGPVHHRMDVARVRSYLGSQIGQVMFGPALMPIYLPTNQTAQTRVFPETVTVFLVMVSTKSRSAGYSNSSIAGCFSLSVATRCSLGK